MGLLDKLKKQTKAKETEQEVEKKEQQPGGAVFIPRSLNEIFADNRKYICQDKVDPAKIRRQFVKEGNRFVVTVGKVSCPSGRLVVGDPLAYLWRDEAAQDVLADTVAPGEYPVNVSIYRSNYLGPRICTAQLKITDKEPVRYELVKAAHRKLVGVPVDTGTAAFVDEVVLEAYQQFIDKWHAENPDGNHYDDYFQALYAASYEKLPEWQREGGDFLAWTVPGTDYQIPFFSTGFGDGFYSMFWGYDEAGEICELIVPFADADDLEKADADFDRMEASLPPARHGIASKKIFQTRKVGYLYREEPHHGPMDSGWVLFEGSEDEAYNSNPDNYCVADLGYICQICPKLITILDKPEGHSYFLNDAGEYEYEELQRPDETDETAGGMSRNTGAESVSTEGLTTKGLAAKAAQEGNWIRDDDEIYELLDQWHENDEYDKILDKIAEIPPERRSNKIYFRKISALNNLSRYNDARRELGALNARCKSPEDRARWFYMLGYIFDNTHCEGKAVECFRQAMEVWPESASKFDLPQMIEDSMGYVAKDMAVARKMLADQIEKLHQACAGAQQVKINELQAYTRMGVMRTILQNGPFRQELDPDVSAYKLEKEEEKETVRKYFADIYGITDLKSLQNYFGKTQIARVTEAAIAYSDGKSDVKPDELDAGTRNYWDMNVRYVSEVGELFPKAGLLAWDLNEVVGMARMMYAADLLTNTELFETYVFAFDWCKEAFSSWEEYAQSLILGGFYSYFIKETDYNIREAAKFASAVGTIAEHTYPGLVWLDKVD